MGHDSCNFQRALLSQGDPSQGGTRRRVGRGGKKQIAELEEWAQLFGDLVKQSAQAKVLEHT